MSYTNTASCVATAYTTRYGRANAGGGNVIDGLCSPSIGLGEEVGLVCSTGDAIGAGGGGSIDEEFLGCLEGNIGSGNAAIASSEDEVSMVI